MRVMVTYYDGNNHKVADLTVDQAQGLTEDQVADDCEDIVSIIEVPRGVDFDKELYARTAEFLYPIMVIK